MSQMIATFEWNDNFGPRWLTKDNLLEMLNVGTCAIKNIAYFDATAKERAQTEFDQLNQRMDKLGSMTYNKFMQLEINTRLALERQYDAMTEYREALLARIEAWTEES